MANFKTYDIIVSHSAYDLAKQVSEAISYGWQPIGSHKVVAKHQQNRFRGQQHVDTLFENEYSQTICKVHIQKQRGINTDGSRYYYDHNMIKWTIKRKKTENFVGWIATNENNGLLKSNTIKGIYNLIDSQK